MGITPDGLASLAHHCTLIGGLSNCRMLEMGDQQMMRHYNIPEGIAAKAWFEHIGVKHTSIDLNGELGAIPLDLSKPINRPEWLEAFDIVTDFGTSEHVAAPITALYNCRSNVHNWCRTGGLMLFSNPKTQHWPGHGYHFFTCAHYEKLAVACNYKIVQIEERATLGNSQTGLQIFAVLMKQNSAPFISDLDFSRICTGTVFPY